MVEVADNCSSHPGGRKRLHHGVPLGEKKKRGEEAQGEAKDQPSDPRPRKGGQLWHVLRKGFRQVVTKLKCEEMKVAYLSHGLQHLCRISLTSPVRHITHDSLKKLFVVLDAENRLHFYREDGLYSSSQKAPAPMVGLLYATQVNHFVAWEEGGLQVLDCTFNLLSQVQSTWPIRCGLYSLLLNQIVTAGDGNLTVWAFRYGFRSLQCRTVVREGLGPCDVFTRIVLDGSSIVSQRCFASCGTGAASFSISTGHLIAFKKELHSRMITDITYCDAVRCAVTASRDTTIKVWDEKWNIKTVFVGHTAPVIAVTTYPQRPLIFSASQDGTIRTWNLETIDQVDQVRVSEPVEALETKTASHVVSISGLTLNLWKINTLYSLFLPLGSPIQRLHCTNVTALGNFPVRVLCICQDATVRLVEAHSGHVLSILFLEPPFQAQEVAYCLPRETLFVLLEHGTLLRVNTAVDPMVVKKSIPSITEESHPCCLLLYNHVVDTEKAQTMWKDVVENKGERKPWQKLRAKTQDKNRYLLILGHQNGLLSVPEWFSGRAQCQVEAHGSERVTALAEYSTETSIISAGADLTVKMWRLFPYSEECLTPLLCFSCVTPALHMCSLDETLAVAFQDRETVTYRIVYYNLMDQMRMEHGPEDDPLDDITGLCCCPNLKLFASASRDGSVKIWDKKNHLLRHLKLNSVPENLAFANHKGDLLVGIERHLYLIDHSNYLPNFYKMELLCAKFLAPLKDLPFPISDSCLETLIRDNARKLMQELPPEEPRLPPPGPRRPALQDSKVIEEIQAKAEGFDQLAERNRDLRLLREGKVAVTKKLRLTKALRDEAFEQYLRIFYKKLPKVEIPEADTFSADEVLEAILRCDSISELYGPSGMFLGCFPQPSVLAANQAVKDVGFPVGKKPAKPSTGIKRIVVQARKSKSEQQMGILGVPPERKMQEPLQQEKAKPRLPLKSPPLETPKPPQQPLQPPWQISREYPKPHLEIPKPLKPLLETLLETPEPPLEETPEPPLEETPEPPLEETPEPPSELPKRPPRIPKPRLKAHKPPLGTPQQPFIYLKLPLDISETPVEPPEPSKPPEPSMGTPVPSLETPKSLLESPHPSLESLKCPPGTPHLPSATYKSQRPVLKAVTRALLFSLSVPTRSKRDMVRGESDEDLSTTPGSSESQFSPAISSQVSPAANSAVEVSKSDTSVGHKESFSVVGSREHVPGSLTPSGSRLWSPSSSSAISEAFSKETFPSLTEPDQPRRLSQVSTGFIPNSVVIQQLYSQQQLSKESFFRRKMGLQTSLPPIFLTQLDEYPEMELELELAELPSFASPYRDTEWFRELFPEGLKSGMSLNQFVNKLLEAMLTADYGLKTEILGAIGALQARFGDVMSDIIHDLLIHILNKKSSAPSLQDQVEQQFILVALRALLQLNKDSRDLMVELMAYYLKAPACARASIKALITEMGVQDPHNFFYREMDSWPVELDDPKEAVRGVCSQWLEGMMATLQEHRRLVLDFEEGRKQFFDYYQKEEPGCDEDEEGLPERKYSLEGYHQAHDASRQWLRYQVVRPIDAVNYFSEKQLERELEEMKEQLASLETETPRDTVMALPPIKKSRAILRLGETNAMLRNRRPERFCFPHIFPRSLVKGFVPFVKLPLPKVNLEPFPPPVSRRPAPPETFTAVQQVVQKYFIPKFSYADSYP